MIKFTNEVRTVIYSTKFSETRRFYEQLLKLDVVKDWDHGDDELGVVYSLGQAFLEVLQTDVIAPASNSYLYIKVENIEQLWNTLSAHVLAEDSIETKAWGHRSFSIQDPNGYEIKFFQEIS